VTPVPKRATLLAAAGLVVGVGAEHAAVAWDNIGDWAPDVLVGWTLIACGLIAMSWRRDSRIGLLLAAAGFTWFLGNAAHVGWPPVAWVGAHLLYVHRGPLIHAVLSFPTGRLASRFDAAVVSVGYLAAAVTPLGGSARAIVALGLLVLIAAARGLPTAAGRGRITVATTTVAAVVLAGGLCGGAIVRLTHPAGDADHAALLGYQAALVCAAMILVAGLRALQWARAAVTDLVVELAETRSGTVRHALARALGDPSLQIGYRLPGTRRYVDGDGLPFDVPAHDPDRCVTAIDVGDEQVAALVHDPAVLRDTGLLASITAAAQLGAANARLQADVRATADALWASRRRLLEADDDERSRLEQRLNDGAGRSLARLAEALAQLRCTAGKSTRPVLAREVERAEMHLDMTRADLGELARGLHPRVLAEGGLSGSIRDLAARAPIPVAVVASVRDAPASVAVAAYFTCAEALSNVAKYAHASRGSVVVEERAGRLFVEVSDDGVGGADPAAGTGLRGLADRIEALGGTFRVDSPPGVGTRVTAEIPLT
jgi:signal transduction histidine kinase